MSFIESSVGRRECKQRTAAERGGFGGKSRATPARTCPREWTIGSSRAQSRSAPQEVDPRPLRRRARHHRCSRAGWMSAVRSEPNTSFGLEDLVGDEAPRFRASSSLDEPVVVRASSDRLAVLRSIPALANATSMLDAWDGESGEVRAWAPLGTTATEIHPKKKHLRSLYDAGFTIVLSGVQDFVPELRVVCRNLERDLGLDVGVLVVEAFCGGAGAGTRAHFDDTTTFNCQLDGTKTWWLAPNDAVRFPPAGMFLDGKMPRRLAAVSARLPRAMPPDAREVVVEPGSVVFLPQGTLHATRTDAASFAVLFSVLRRTPGDALAKVVKRRLRRVELLRTPPLERRHLAPQAIAKAAAAELRRLAEEIEAAPSEVFGDCVMRLASGMRLDIHVSDRSATVVVDDAGVERATSVPVQVGRLLAWANARRAAFTLRDAARAHPDVAPRDLERSVDALMRTGLFEQLE
jgi:hypothetical protein